MKIRGQLPAWAVLSIFGVIGFLLIAVPDYFGWVFDKGISRDIGIAALTTAFLGTTIDRWLKSEIAADVFKAALGYILPDEFRDEVRRITNYKFVCERHSLIVVIEPINEDCVRVTTTTERTLRNITDQIISQKNILHIDEWGFAEEKSRIIDCQIFVPGSPPKVFSEVGDKHNSTLYAETDDVQVFPGQLVKLSSKFVQIGRSNDDVSMSYMAPTKDPEIEVRAPDIFQCEISFGSPNDAKVDVATYSNKKILRGTYFPLQTMRVRWWKGGSTNLSRPMH